MSAHPSIRTSQFLAGEDILGPIERQARSATS